MNKDITTQNSIESDEIDLVELVKVLWDKKWWIVLSTFICTSIAGIYAFTAKEQWTSKAEIIAPRPTDLGNYLSLRKEYARILGIEFDINNLSNELYNKFERLAYSLDKREDFLINSDIYKFISENKNEEQKRKLLSQLARENINIIKPNTKKDPKTIDQKFSFSAETPELAQNSLLAFINYVNQLAFQAELNDFLVLFNEKLADLNFEYNKMQKNLEIQKLVQLENLNKAYDIAKKAEVKEYLKSEELYRQQNVIVTSDAKISLSDSKLSDNSYLFMLGEKFLKAQIDIISNKGIIYPPNYYQTKEQLENLYPLLEKVKLTKANSFSYLNKPNYPIVKDKPKKAIILIIGFILGIVISFIILLINTLFRKRV